MNLTKLQKEAHAIAKLKGWWDTERTFGDCIALVHSELSEALEAYRIIGNMQNGWGGKITGHGHEVVPKGVPYELADVVIRVADMAEWYGLDIEPCVESIGKHPKSYYGDDSVLGFGDWIAVGHKHASDAFWDYVQFPNTQKYWLPLASLIACMQTVTAHYGIDLDAAIAAKMEYNRTRPYRHGGKAL